jgi:hypothetical protein
MSDRPKLPENPPFAKGPYWVNGAMWICGVDAYGGTCHIADMRGWGYLTGHGMALALSNDDAFNAQKDTANWIVAAMNAYAQPAPVTLEEAARVADLVSAVSAEIEARNLYLSTAPDRGGTNGTKGQRKKNLENAQLVTLFALRALAGDKP